MKYLCAKLTLFLLFTFSNFPELHAEGFLAGTLVKVPHGYTKIENVQVGDDVVCLDDEKKLAEGVITYVGKKPVSHYVRVQFGGESVEIACDQLFWNAENDVWIDASSLSMAGILVKENVDAYLIGVAQYHNFLVTKADICVHNFFPPVIVALSVAFGSGTIEIASVSAGFAGLGAFLGYKWHKKDKEKHKFVAEPQFYGNGMMPEDPEEEKKRKRDEARNNYESLNNQEAKKLAEKMGFRIDKNPPFQSHGKIVFRKGNTYISADRAGHKGGVWKVFRRGEGRLGSWNVDLTKRIGD
jgi:hypothetical protein